MIIESIGYTAVVIGAISTGPQIYQIIKTKQVRDINFKFFFLRAFSSILYIIYGILKYDYVMMSSAIMPFILEISVIILYLKYKNNQIQGGSMVKPDDIKNCNIIEIK
jgi:MtN3 and saliva related transmembrane protein